MKFSRLGKNGLVVPRVALGTWTFGSGPGMSSIFLRASTEQQLQGNLHASELQDQDFADLQQISAPALQYPTNLIRQCDHFDNAIERAIGAGL
jgi:aryl-alcohol dehydrogenase-like predicted oxidoreductase